MLLRKFCMPVGLLLLTSATGLAQAPAVNTGGIVNHFSLAAPAMPNGGIAQGSLFDINGRNLGPADPVQVTDVPLSAALSGVSAQVTVAGKTVDVLISSVSSAKIVALLPSGTPLGTGTLTVSVNGVKSATSPITVVKTSLGIQTANGAGYGPAAMNMSDGNGGFIPNSRDVTIQPGQTAIFLATGAGAVSFDETTGAPTQDLDLDVRAYVGGVEAQIVYKGSASGQVGVNEFDVVIPDLAASCSAGVVFVTGTIVSNFTSIAVGDGGPCYQTTNLVPTEGFLRSGAIELVRSVSRLATPILGANEILVDTGVSAFSSIDFSKLVQVPQTPTPVIGPCIVSTLPPPPQPSVPATNAVGYLDAGAVFTIKGPNGTRTLAKQPTGFGSTLGQAPVFAGAPDFGPPYVVPGDYTFDNGAGGKDIGPFNVKFTMAQPAVWTNGDAIGASGVTRSAGLDITWTPGGDPEALISIGGNSRLGNGQPGGTFSCSVKEKDAGGHLTIPPFVLMVLPPSAVQNGQPTGVLTFIWTSVNPLVLPEIDQGNIAAATGFTRTLNYK
jgi:uncharacterized protein (TIGR03437 family)